MAQAVADTCFALVAGACHSAIAARGSWRRLPTQPRGAKLPAD